MNWIRILAPSPPTTNGLFVCRFRWFSLALVQPCHPAAKVLLNGFAQKGMCVIKDETKEINAACIHGEHLVVALYFQLQSAHIFPDVTQQSVQWFLVGCKSHNDICVTPIIFHALCFLYPMVKVCQEQISKVLGKIVADWNAVQWCCHQFTRDWVGYEIPNWNVRVGVWINDFIKQCQKAIIFYFTPYHAFQHFMVDRRVKLPNVNLQAIFCPGGVFSQCLFYRHCASVDAPVLDARIGVARENGHPYWFKNVHHGVMQYPVGIIWQLIYFTFLWFVNLKNVILGRVKRSIFQWVVQSNTVGFPVLIVQLHAIRMQLSLAGFFVREFQIVNRYDFFKKVAISFHCFAWIIGFFGLAPYQNRST